MSFLQRAMACDRALLLSLLIGLIFGAQGLTWGGYDCLNLDRMAFRDVTNSKRGYLEPSTFDKPPFYTYLVHFGIVVPGDALARRAGNSWTDKITAEGLRLRGELIAARLAQLAMFAACIIFVFGYAHEFFGLAAARASAVLLATAAGFVPYEVFLTTDLALIFWMLAALTACRWVMRSPGIAPSILAGVLTGLATATKYNGLAVGLGIPLAHLLAPAQRPLITALKRPGAYLGVLAVPIAFIAVNPYCLIRSEKFVADFMFNYRVTPVYSGETGYGYHKFALAFSSIFGGPMSWLLIPLVLLGVWMVLSHRHERMWRGLVLVAACFFLYAWKIGSFPRVETRFVIPAAPFALLMAAPGFSWLAARSRWLLVALVVPLACYGLACSWYTARRFAEDPRMAALTWAEKNFPAKAHVESSGSCPNWKRMPGRKLDVKKMPYNTDQIALFDKLFPKDHWVQDRNNEDRTERSPSWYTAEELAKRNPDYITADSIDLRGASTAFYEQLLAGRLGYRIVFDRESALVPAWVYPEHPEFVGNRITIFERVTTADKK
ncbi:hypothetical protein BH09VER1_BH09VER1_25700 [soil metagenome]